SLAVGALARLEHDGASADEISRFRTALRGPLGTLGDRTVWAEWRPFCLLLGITLFGLGLGAVWSAGAFLVTYNAGHLWIRIWGFRCGWRQGRDVGKHLREFPFERFTERLWPVTMFLLGAATVLLGREVVATAGSVGSWVLLLAAGLTAIPAFRWPNQFGRLAVGLFMALPVVWILLAIAGQGR
ncbi:MAG: PTS system mannose/fructose/sorbose family transporter subunit IID, partial [Gemmatimonadota bacterium]|nr:PTS system mannose/fructose/sorbose family transporter subunit IID [Gemmatimonadota bacterium]